MKKKLIILLCIICIQFVFCISFVYADIENKPKLNNGKPWKIAYYEGGPYSEYTDTMRTLVKGLIKLGWITNKNPPEYYKERPLPYINWLNKNAGPYLYFDVKNSYSADWDQEKRDKIKKTFIEKLQKKEVDLIIAMGTYAGLDLINNQHSVPVMLMSTSDPIRTGIIKSVEDSGYDHVTARVDPKRYLRQLRMFHRIVKFKKLGIAFEDTPEGRSYSAISEAKEIAQERGFELVTCVITEDTPSKDLINKSCFDCFDKLNKEVDAIYLTALMCADFKTTELAESFKKAKIPTFSMLGSKWVKKGIMMSISSDSGYAATGYFNADKFGKILNGAKPRDLNQLCEDPLEIAINIDTIKTIGFKMPESIIQISSEIYYGE